MTKIMSRAGIPRAKMSILISSCKDARQVDRQYMSKTGAVLVDDHHPDENLTGGRGSYKDDHQMKTKMKSRSSSGCNWVPHPRSGIYFPEGQEWVMDDVPKEAASFGTTFWLRKDDVDKPDPDHPHWNSNYN